MNPKGLFGELKRRNVYKVAVAYAVVGWLLIQVATQVFPFLEISNWAIRLVIFVTALGFPVALVIAWAFELTPEGIKRTEDADAAGQHSRGHVWIAVIVIATALSVGCFSSADIPLNTQHFHIVRRIQRFQRNQLPCCHSVISVVIPIMLI